MGLEIIELVMNIEEEFGISIPDDRAEELRTVGETHQYVWSEISRRAGTACLGAHCFYLLRSALCSLYRVRRENVRRDTPLLKLVSRWRLNGERLEAHTGLRTPWELSVDASVGDLAVLLARINRRRLSLQFRRRTKAECYRAIQDIVVDVLRVPREWVVPEASFINDLGAY